ncbi:hypothetical protein GCM10009639_49550 [Kitasatospora putterlickiae]|uniref:Uncharacterized protein n=1 Tax=Kitasatospora putterlickiae TaxID=221725 RepID=A0ABN1YE39_9ACTN
MAASPALALDPAEPQAVRESAAAVSTAAKAAARARCTVTGKSPVKGAYCEGAFAGGSAGLRLAKGGGTAGVSGRSPSSELTSQLR